MESTSLGFSEETLENHSGRANLLLKNCSYDFLLHWSLLLLVCCLLASSVLAPGLSLLLGLTDLLIILYVYFTSARSLHLYFDLALCFRSSLPLNSVGFRSQAGLEVALRLPSIQSLVSISSTRY